MLPRQRYFVLLGGHIMIKIASLSTIAAALFSCGLSAAPAQAQANRTFVSGTGTDSGTCERAAPCKTFAFALTQTAAGGEIDVLDPADYGTVSITQSISIVNDGAGVASIEAGSGNAITINAGPVDRVHLRGLTIEGLGSGANGILFSIGGRLDIENCVIRNFASAGINISPGTTSSFSVSNTIASNNGGFGILGQTTNFGVVVKGVLSKVITNTNGLTGIAAVGINNSETFVTIVDSEASNNVGFGIRAAGSGSGGDATVMVRNVVASYNNVGLEAGNFGLLWVTHSAATGNRTGLSNSGGRVLTFGNNDIGGNSVNSTGTLEHFPPQ
jgi:hypothetical protein